MASSDRRVVHWPHCLFSLRCVVPIGQAHRLAAFHVESPSLFTTDIASTQPPSPAPWSPLRMLGVVNKVHFSTH
jgi:hypothetical protein